MCGELRALGVWADTELACGHSSGVTGGLSHRANTQLTDTGATVQLLPRLAAVLTSFPQFCW